MRKLFKNLWILRSLTSSVYFNFHYLPFKQAIKLPILLYKPKFIRCKGKVSINSSKNKITTGMIILGTYDVSLYQNNGFVFENNGDIVFEGTCRIGNNSALSIGETGKVVFGDNFNATTSLKIVSYKEIIFEKNVLCGWECFFCDTDFHRVTMENGTEQPKGYGNIKIGEGCWLGFKSIVLKSTFLPPHCIVAANSLLNKKYNIPPKSLLAGQPAEIRNVGVYRNPDNDTIEYNSSLNEG